MGKCDYRVPMVDMCNKGHCGWIHGLSRRNRNASGQKATVRWRVVVYEGEGRNKESEKWAKEEVEEDSNLCGYIQIMESTPTTRIRGPPEQGSACLFHYHDPPIIEDARTERV